MLTQQNRQHIRDTVDQALATDGASPEARAAVHWAIDAAFDLLSDLRRAADSLERIADAADSIAKHGLKAAS